MLIPNADYDNVVVNGLEWLARLGNHSFQTIDGDGILTYGDLYLLLVLLIDNGSRFVDVTGSRRMVLVEFSGVTVVWKMLT